MQRLGSLRPLGASACRSAVALCLIVAISACQAAGLVTSSGRLLAEGERLASENRTGEAILAYRQAVDADGRNLVALRKLAAGYAGQGRVRLARHYLEQAQRVRAADPETAAALAALPARDPQPLELLWQREVAADVPTGMALDGGVLYVATEGGTLQGLAVQDGSVRLNHKLASILTAKPVAAGGLVLLGGQDGTLRALSNIDGQERWHLQTRAPIYAAPLLEGDSIYCPSSDGTLYAVDAGNGRVRWEFPAGAPLYATPTLAEGVLYFGAVDGRLHALDALTGRPVWEHGILTQGSIEAQPTVADGRVYAGSGDSRIYALAVASGGEYWRYSTADTVYARPIIAGDTVYVASNGYVVAALDTLSGEARWEHEMPGPVAYTPAFDGKTLYAVVTARPQLYALDAATGELRWQVDTGDWPASEPLLAPEGGVLYLAGKDGSVLAYRMPE